MTELMPIELKYQIYFHFKYVFSTHQILEFSLEEKLWSQDYKNCILLYKSNYAYQIVTVKILLIAYQTIRKSIFHCERMIYLGITIFKDFDLVTNKITKSLINKIIIYIII